MLGSREIGKLDKRVTFLLPIITDGTSNEDKISGWEEVTSDPTVWASKKDLKGNDIVVTDKVNYMQMTDYVIRNRSDITTKNRLVCDQQVYEIVSIQNDESRRFQIVKASILLNVLWS